MTYQMPDDAWLRNVSPPTRHAASPGASLLTPDQVFAQVDRDRSGEINAAELQAALSNGTWKPFNPETVRLFVSLAMCACDRAHSCEVQIGMFDRDQTGTIKFEEFKHLWKYVTDWLNW